METVADSFARRIAWFRDQIEARVRGGAPAPLEQPAESEREKQLRRWLHLDPQQMRFVLACACVAADPLLHAPLLTIGGPDARRGLSLATYAALIGDVATSELARWLETGPQLVRLGRARQPLGYQMPPKGGHYVSVNHKYQKFYRVPQRTHDAGPSNYGMTAPQEFFAECYAEYYRQYTGPGTESMKGGRLAGWIKTWFDGNVDTLKYNPSRKDR